MFGAQAAADQSGNGGKTFVEVRYRSVRPIVLPRAKSFTS